MNPTTPRHDIVAAIAYCQAAVAQADHFSQALALRYLKPNSRSGELQGALAAQVRRALDTDWPLTAPLGELLTVVNALHVYNASQVAGADIAQVVQRLVAAEVTPGGPYRERSSHPDIYTNQQVQDFASWAAGPLPQVTAFLTSPEAQHSEYASWLYDTAAAPLGAQLSNGSWPPVDIRLQPVRTTSSLVSTARAIAALDINTTNEQPDTLTYTERILARTNHEISMIFDGSQGDVARQTLIRISNANHAQEISLIAYYFADIVGVKLSLDDLTLLGQANVYCWLGYTLYDTIIDTQSHTASMPIVTAAVRHATTHYRKYLPEGALRIEQVFDAMDKANIWELRHARYAVEKDTITIGRLPQYGDLAQLARRSGGHTLGPLLVAQRYQSKYLDRFTRGLQHYLIARQLHDDAHDWQADLRAGHISFVVACLLRGASITPGPYVLEALVDDLQALFWRQTAMEICDRIDEHLAHARRLLTPETGHAGARFDALIARLESASQQTRQQHQRGAQFVQHFQQQKNRPHAKV